MKKFIAEDLTGKFDMELDNKEWDFVPPTLKFVLGGAGVGVGSIFGLVSLSEGLTAGAASLSIWTGGAFVLIGAGVIAYTALEWDYQTQLDSVAELMATDFDDKIRLKIIFQAREIYEKIVFEFEKHNKFIQ